MSFNLTTTNCAECQNGTTQPRIANCTCILCPACITKLQIDALIKDRDVLVCRRCFPILIFKFQSYDANKQYEVETSHQPHGVPYLALRQRELAIFREAKEKLGTKAAVVLVNQAVAKDNSGLETLAGTMERLLELGTCMVQDHTESAGSATIVEAPRKRRVRILGVGKEATRMRRSFKWTDDWVEVDKREVEDEEDSEWLNVVSKDIENEEDAEWVLV